MSRGQQQESRTDRALLRALDRPDSVWNRAAEAADCVDPFACRSEWQLSYYETFKPRAKLYVRHDQTSLIAFTEAFTSIGPALVPVDSSWQFASPLLGENAADLLLDLVEELDTRFLKILLSGISDDCNQSWSHIHQLLRGKNVTQLPVVHTERMVSASLDGGLDGYWSRRRGRLRRDTARNLRRATAAGVTFERCAPDNREAARSAYQRILDIESRSWKGIGQCGMNTGQSRPFYRRILERLSVNRGGRIIFALHGDRDIGFIFGGMAGGVYRGQQFSYDNEWSSYSIGNLLQHEKVRWLCEEGALRYDMGPWMHYKDLWTEISTTYYTVVLEP
jgi:hypothetical protein